MAGEVAIVVTGVREAQRHLDPAAFSRGLRDGLKEAGALLERAQREIVAPHHFRGTWEQQIHTEIRGSGLNMEAHVGVSASRVPEARPMTYGWVSSSGHQPPTEAIADWLSRKPDLGASSNVYRNASGFVRTRAGSGGFRGVSQEAGVRSMAFLIARAIKRRGYTFGTGQGGQKLDTLRKALEATRDRIGPAILKHLRPGVG